MMYRPIALMLGALLFLSPVQSRAQGAVASTDTVRLSLHDAVDLGLRAGDEIGLSAAEALSAEAQYDLARGSLLPQLRLNSSYARTFESARSNAVSAVFNQPNTYNVNANFSQTLFQGGRLLATARAANALADAA